MKENFSTKDIIYFWQKHWSKKDIYTEIEGCKISPILQYFTTYLPKKGIILEAGCGLGQWLVVLKELGYNIIGLEIVQD